MLEHTDVARSYVTAAIGLLQRSGFRVSLNFDLGSWASLLRGAPSILVVNPTFDPERSQVEPGAGFWIGINDDHGPAACIADRLFVTDNFLDEMRSGRLWSSTPGDEDRAELLGTLDAIHYPGRVGHAGGLWIHPRARKAGLSWLLPRLARAFSVINWNVDRHCGIILSGLYGSGMGKQAYGFPEAHLCIDGYCPPFRRSEQLLVVHITRDQIIEQLGSDLERIRDAPDQQMRDVATIISHRHEQPAIRQQAV